MFKEKQPADINTREFWEWFEQGDVMIILVTVAYQIAAQYHRGHKKKCAVAVTIRHLTVRNMGSAFIYDAEVDGKGVSIWVEFSNGERWRYDFILSPKMRIFAQRFDVAPPKNLKDTKLEITFLGRWDLGKYEYKQRGPRQPTSFSTTYECVTDEETKTATTEPVATEPTTTGPETPQSTVVPYPSRQPQPKRSRWEASTHRRKARG